MNSPFRWSAFPREREHEVVKLEGEEEAEHESSYRALVIVNEEVAVVFFCLRDDPLLMSHPVAYVQHQLHEYPTSYEYEKESESVDVVGVDSEGEPGEELRPGDQGNGTLSELGLLLAQYAQQHYDGE